MGKTLDKLLGGAKNFGRKAVVGGMIAVAGVGLTSEKAKGTLIPAGYATEQAWLDANPNIVKLQNFNYFLDNGSGGQYTCNNMDFLVYNSETGENEIPTDKYHFAWLNVDGTLIDGAAENGHYGYNNFIEGFYSADLPNGYQPPKLNIVKDGDEDGPGYFNNSTGKIVLGTDDISYSSNDVLFGDLMIRGDVSQISPKSTEQWLYQPKMVLSPIPEPMTLLPMIVGAVPLISNRAKKIVTDRLNKKGSDETL